jgi:phosphoribosylanthranilate isomerase
VIVKICGITRLEDALHAAAHGATALGFVFWPRSARCVDAVTARRIVRALPPEITAVGVFVNQRAADVRAIADVADISVIQLHGDERAEYAAALNRPVWRASADAAVLDAWSSEDPVLLDGGDPVRRGGTGSQADWNTAAALAARRPLILAGGLDPQNVSSAIGSVRPAGVDVSSGVERAPGIKDPDRVARFLGAALEAFHEHHH